MSAVRFAEIQHVQALADLLSDLAQAHALDGVILSLLEDQARPVLRGLDVLFEVGVVDLFPDPQGLVRGLLHRELRETVEVGGAILERLFPQAQEALQIPFFDVPLLRVHVDREVAVVGDEDPVSFGELR